MVQKNYDGRVSGKRHGSLKKDKGTPEDDFEGVITRDLRVWGSTFWLPC